MWLSLTVSVPVDICEVPPVGWTLEDQTDGWTRFAGKTDDHQQAFDKCQEMGGVVYTSDTVRRLMCYGTSAGFQRPCMSEPGLVLLWQGMYAPGPPRFGCDDTVLELVPEDKADWSVKWFDGSLSFKGPRI